MALPCRKQLTQLLSVLCVTVCCIAVLRDMCFSKHGLYNNSHDLRPRYFTSKLTYNGEFGGSFANAPYLPKKNMNSPDIHKSVDSSKNLENIQETKVFRLDIKGSDSLVEQRNLRNSLELTRQKHNEQQPQVVNLQKSYADMNVENIEILTANLTDKLEKVAMVDTKVHSRETCNSTVVIGNSCSARGCLRLRLPRQPHTRIEQIVRPNHLQMSVKYRDALSAMAAKIPRHMDLIVVSAVSSNHYLESQALLYNLHHNLFPHLSNFTFVYYNLGLTPAQRRYLASICRCVMIDFPFEMFPGFVSTLKCYTWKPLIVNTVIQRAELVFWVDASIRFKPDPKYVLNLLDRSRKRGIQMGWSATTISKTTLPSMFHFFGDEACAYVPYNQGLSGVVIFHNEWLVRRVVLEPWAACALSAQCMCPQTGVDLFKARITCHMNRGKYFYGICHRFDQSALSILLTKLYQENVNHVMLRDITQFVDIKRGDQRPYGTPADE